MSRFVFSALFGVLIVLTVIFFYRKFLLSEEFKSVPIGKFSPYSPPSIDPMFDVKVGIASWEERISSLNKRIDDFYIFGGIIVTLLLAINVGVFVNTDREIKKHIEENFGVHKAQIIGLLKEAESASAEIKTKLDLLDSLIKSKQKEITPP